MKRLLFVCAAVVGALTTPLAANYNYNCCPPQCDPCCSSDFNGFYIGGNLGIFSHTAHRNDLDGFFTDNSGWSSIDTSFTAGLQLGYDWQCCNTVAGVVIDWNWVDTNHRHADDPNGAVGNRFQRHRNEWFTTIRGRVGVTVCDALVYITGGAAVTQHRIRYEKDTIGEGGGTGRFNDNHNRWGWVGGVGTEFMLGCNWSLGAELLFLQFSNRNRTFTGLNSDLEPARFAFGASDSAVVGRILLNYRFGDLFGGCCW